MQLVALAGFDCHRGLALLAESIAEYQAEVDIRDYIWTRKAVLPHAPAAKVADFAAKRRQSEAVKPQGQTPARGSSRKAAAPALEPRPAFL